MSAQKQFSRIEGYIAAERIIEEHLNSTHSTIPKRFKNAQKKSAAYRQGYHDGLLFAYCQLALGFAPENNADAIAKIYLSKIP